MEANGEDTKGLKAPETDNTDYVACEHCLRKFAPNVAEKHIPACKFTQHRPKPPKSIVGEEGMMESKTKSLTAAKHRLSHQHEVEDEYDIRPKTEYNPLKYADNSLQDRSATANKDSKNAAGRAFRVRKKAGTIEVSRSDNPNDPLNLKNPIEFPQSDNGFLNMSPNNAFNKLRKTIISEPLPKRGDLLKNYEPLHAKVAHHSTVQCQYCLRNFAPKVADRHIPICQNLRNTRIMKPMFENGRMVKDAPRGPFSAGVNVRNPQKKITSINNLDGGFEQEGKQKARQASLTRNSGTGSKQNLKLEVTSNRISKTNPEQFPKPKANRIINELMQFCTNCGGKVMKQHRFCGHCGTAKADAHKH